MEKMGMLVWLFKCLSFPLFILLLSQAIFSPVSFTSFVHLCPPDQNLALLQFKSMISLNNYSYGNPLAKPRKIQSWKEGTDCCLWEGVSCDNVTGNVIGLNLANCYLYGTIDSNSSLFLLSHLQSLNLSYNDFFRSNIPSKISELISLTHLDLTYSGFSGPVPQEISHLSNLVSLDLSYNSYLYMETPAVKRLVQNMTKLRVLSIHLVGMRNVAPHSLVNLSSSLRSLGLDYCYLGENHGGEFPVNIFQLPNLQSIYLSHNSMIIQFPESNWTSPIKFLEAVDTGLAIKIPYSIGDLKNLEFLNIEGTGELPNSIGNLVSLKQLNLGGTLTGSIPASIGNLTQITDIHLYSTNLSGELPLSLGKLQNLMVLDLGNNSLTGEIPNAFTNLTKLTSINLHSNNFNGQLPLSLFNLSQPIEVDFSFNQLTGHIPSYISSHASLLSLDISYNLLKGAVPSWLFVLPLLNSLDLSYNQLDGHIPDFQVNSSELLHVGISNNKLHGPIPSSLFELELLTYLDLSSNNMAGFLHQEMISKLKNLSSLDLSYNSRLSLTPSSTFNLTFPSVLSLGLSSCNITEFPIFLKDSTLVQEINLSNNKIHGHIPEWFLGLGKNSLRYLNLSLNFLISFRQYPWNQLEVLDLHSNLLQGSLPAVLPSTRSLFLSKNKLYGEIPPSFCNSLGILDLSNNNLNGRIPQCLLNFSDSISVLDLRMNNFYGGIPEFINCKALTTLGLNGNQLEGVLPRSLLNCEKLEILDVGNNKITGEFPHWLGSLANLQVLVLRSNNFHGPVLHSKTKFPFPMLRILDVSHNEFTGPLPAFYFKKFKAMMTPNHNKNQLEYMGKKYIKGDYYQNHMMVTMKGVDVELVRILSIFTTIDLSNNNFSGKIPRNFGKLKSLKGLNFSHNNLVGHIPSSMGSLTNLEWLDLSSNELSGKIPEQLLDITFLEVLNLSYNKLVGQIPVGGQFNTFSNNSYIGNLGLCGFPLSKECNQSETKAPPVPPFVGKHNASCFKIEFEWKVVAVGYGCGVLFGLIMGYLVFSTGKPQWLVRLVGANQPRRKLKRPRIQRGCHGSLD